MAVFNFVIRDAVASDIADCLALDDAYESDYVWQMSRQQTADGWQVSFRKERLPRAVEVAYPVDEMRLRLALAHEHCFLVAVGKDEPLMLGYVSMRIEPIHKIALIQDLLVGRQFRHGGVGSRLLHIARAWAQEHEAKEIMVEVPSRNYPAIEFLQNRGLQFCGFNDQYFRNQDIAVFFGQSLR